MPMLCLFAECHIVMLYKCTLSILYRVSYMSAPLVENIEDLTCVLLLLQI